MDDDEREWLSDDEWIRDDPRGWLDDATECTGCGRPTHKAEVIRGVVVGWDDLCWQRFVVRWKRRVVARDQESA